MNSAVNRTRVKICGITRPEDGLEAANAGADAIGLVFWGHSPRAVSISRAAEICRALPAFVSVVALTVDAKETLVKQIVDELPIDLLQFHGDETPEMCESYNKPYLKALRMRPGLPFVEEVEKYSNARAVLTDTYRKGVPGGTGESFDWDLIPNECSSRIVLAGGLNPSNATSAVQTVRPYAVDVSGGVEASPGIKEKSKIIEFINAVRDADRIDGASR